MDKTAITVTMTLKQFEDLKDAWNRLDDLVRVLERANPDGKSAVMTDELRQRILDIYC